MNIDQFDKYAIRKKKIIRQSLLISLGYFIVFISTTAAKIAGLSSIKSWQIIFCACLSMGGMLIYILIIIPQKKISNLNANIIYFTQFILWLILYTFFVFWVNEIRSVALLFAIMALLFVISNSNFIESLIFTISATSISLVASYICIFFPRRYISPTFPESLKNTAAKSTAPAAKQKRLGMRFGARWS